ncbi:hypothetical protein CHUAL_008173 [Chamberlinius hualienensis]
MMATKMMDELNILIKSMNPDESGPMKVIIDAINALIEIKDMVTSSINVTELIAKAILSGKLYSALVGIFRNVSELFQRNVDEEHIKDTIQLAAKSIEERKKVVQKIMEDLKSAIMDPLFQIQQQKKQNCCTAEGMQNFVALVGRFDFCVQMLSVEIKSCQQSLNEMDRKIDEFLGSTAKKAYGGLMASIGSAVAAIGSVIIISNPIGLTVAAGAFIANEAGWGIYSIYNKNKLKKNKPTLDQTKKDLTALQSYFNLCKRELQDYVLLLQNYGVPVADYPNFL